MQFEIDADGILQVLARDTATGREKIVPIQSAVDVSDDRVQEMVEESVEHAFEDMDARRWVEAALKAGEAVKAARDGLEAFRDEVDNAQIIDEAISAVEGLLQSADNDQGRFDGAQGSRGAVGSGDPAFGGSHDGSRHGSDAA